MIMKLRGIDLRSEVVSSIGQPYVDSREIQKNQSDKYEYAGNYNFSYGPPDQLYREPPVSPVTGILQNLGFLPAGVPQPKRMVRANLSKVGDATCGLCSGPLPCLCSKPLGEDDSDDEGQE
jgi:hypothetical protein